MGTSREDLTLEGRGIKSLFTHSLYKMKLALFIILSVLHCQNNAYKIVTLPKADEEHHSMKVFFSTKMVDVTHKVTTTVTQTAYETCYAAEPGISECKNSRDNEDSEPKVELNGVATSLQSVISPSKTARAERQLDLEDLEEVVEIIEASENVQVIQPDEVAAVVYASVVHKSKEEEPILVEQVIEELNEVEPFEDELESRTEIPEVKTYTHEQGNLLNAEADDTEGEVDNTDELVRENSFDLNFEDETQGEMATTEVSEVKHYAHELDDETTTSDPEMAEMTTMMEENYELEEANPARENLDGPILESSWEEKEVVITNSINTKCMDMKNDLFINVMSTILWTMTETKTVTVNGLNSVLF